MHDGLIHSHILKVPTDIVDHIVDDISVHSGLVEEGRRVGHACGVKQASL
jgi:hypothetical protein